MPVVYNFALVETLTLRALQRPTFTAFRIFTPLEVLPIYLTREAHLVSAVCLLWIPVMVFWEKRGDKSSYAGPVARLFKRWERLHRRVA